MMETGRPKNSAGRRDIRARVKQPPARGETGDGGTVVAMIPGADSRHERASDMRRRMRVTASPNEEEHRASPFYKGKRIGNDPLVLCFTGVFPIPYTMTKTRFKTMELQS